MKITFYGAGTKKQAPVLPFYTNAVIEMLKVSLPGISSFINANACKRKGSPLKGQAGL